MEGHSIYIKNLPLNATAAQVEEVFSKFGTIRPGGVQVRNHKVCKMSLTYSLHVLLNLVAKRELSVLLIQIDRFCFGFVEFELLASMQAAIEVIY